MSKNKTPLKGEQKRGITEIAEEATSWIEKNSKLFVVSFIALSLVLISVWAVSSINQKNAEKVAKASGVVNRKIELLEKSISESSPKETEAQAKKDKFEARKLEEMNKVTLAVEELISEYPSKVTTNVTTVKWSKFLVENDKEDEALKLLNSLKIDTKSEFAAIPTLMKAGILAKKDQTDEALKIYEEALNTPSWSLFENEILIQKAALHQSKGETEEAIKLLSKVKDEDSENSKYVDDSRKYMRLLKLNKSGAGS